MIRANKVIDHILAILRERFKGVMDGGRISYPIEFDPSLTDDDDGKNRSVSSTGTFDPEPETIELSWNKMYIDYSLPKQPLGEIDPVDRNTQTVISEEMPTLIIWVFPLAESSDGQTMRGQVASTTLQVLVVVISLDKDDRVRERLENAVFAIVEQELLANQKLAHPLVPEFGNAAYSVAYQGYQIEQESQDSVVPFGHAYQTYHVKPFPNAFIPGLMPVEGLGNPRR